MRIIQGLLIFLPFVGVSWLAFKIVDACIKKGGLMRLLGILVSLIIGGSSVAAGYFIGPIVGWTIMALGGFVIVVGSWRSLVVTKEDVELQELEEELEKETKGVKEEREGKVQQVPTAQQGVTCPGCGSPNSLGQRFCVSCGSRLTAACPRCGAIVDTSSRFCTKCGAGLV